MTSSEVVCPRCNAKPATTCVHVKSGLPLAKPHAARAYLASRSKPSPEAAKKERTVAKKAKEAISEAISEVERAEREKSNCDVLRSLTAPLRRAARAQDEKPKPKPKKWHSCMSDGCENDTGDPQKLKCDACDSPRELTAVENVWRRNERCQQEKLDARRIDTASFTRNQGAGGALAETVDDENDA